MKLPAGDGAVVDADKLRNDCLSRTHPRGRHKARMFARHLGLGRDHGEILGGALLRAASNADAVARRSDQYGARGSRTDVVDREVSRARRRQRVGDDVRGQTG